VRKLKRALIVFLSLLLCAVPGPAAAQAPPTTATNLHCLWKAVGKSNVVYFLGSIHELRKTDYPLPQIAEFAFTNCQIAAFERDFSKIQDSNSLAVLRAKTKLPAGTTLRQVLPASIYVSFSNHVEEAGLSMARSFDSLRPAFAVEKLDLIKLDRLDARFDYGVDTHFFKLAQQTGKQIVGFETTEFQTDLVANLSDSEQELWVEDYLAEVDNREERYNRLVSAWKNGNSAEFEQFVKGKVASLHKKLDTDRTRSWMPQIRKLLQGRENAIVIVGAAHLVGADGVVELLKKEGVKVTQL
jgi:uncharacterized protein YbaP (TraB family)